MHVLIKTSGPATKKDTQISFLRFALWQYEYICMSTAIVERSFSSMNRVMTVERTGRTDDHLDDTIFLYLLKANHSKSTQQDYNRL